MVGITLLLLASCSSADAPTATVERATVTPIPVFQYVAPTEPPQMATISAMTAVAGGSDVALDATKVERGRDRYVALECGTCHGDAGEGTDDGPPLADFVMTEDEFISFMRSGGSSGAAHQYSTNRLSASGGSNLYQYLVSMSSS